MKTLTLTALRITFLLSTFAMAEEPPQQQWVSRYAGTGNFDDSARDVAVDASGNVYVTGLCIGIGGSYDYITVKYDPAGNQLWAARFDDPTHGADQPSAIAVDASGNVYVTGQRVSGVGQYYATVKYDPNGNQLWVSYYSGTSNSNTSAKAIAVDNSGNVYVTGVNRANSTSTDFVTVKYGPNGNEIWVSRYTGLVSGSTDSAEAIALDSSGNVYVTGSSGASNLDYATVKYNANGSQLWAARYNGDGNAADYAYTIAVDSSQNVYVGGRSTGSGTGYDYATVKYNSSGGQVWAARYNGPGNSNDRIYKLVLDSSANVYVTGESSGTSSALDYATIKYNSSGTQLWVSRYNGPGNGIDMSRDIAIDGSGNTYVTGLSAGIDGYDYATVKYGPDGSQLWVTRYNGPANGQDSAYAIAFNGSNIFVTGESTFPDTYKDYATIKYDLNGNQVWLARYNGQAYLNDSAYGVTIDDGGNVYVTGAAAGSTDSYDCTTIKYGPDGNRLWVAQYDANHFTDVGQKAIVDHNGNVYVFGRSTINASPASTDYLTIKYDPNGDQLWATRYDGPGNGYDVLNDQAVDNSGNVYITGLSPGSGTGDDYATVKYDPNGNQLWVARYDSGASNSDQAIALAVDGSGNVYVTGYSFNSSTRDDYVTIKYDPNGLQLWTTRYNGPASGDDEARAIALDASGNIYVTGGSSGSSGYSDYATVKYDPSGTQLWVARYNGPGNKSDWPLKLVLDDACNVYITGYSVGSSGDYDYATVKYRPDGNQAWVARYSSSGSISDQANGLAVDHFGNVYVTGISDENYVTIKYDANGNQRWLMSYNGPGNDHDSAWDLTIDNFGSVYVTGESASVLGDYDFATIKYTQQDYCFEALAGDYNGDCKVQFADLAILGNAWRAGYGLPDLEKLADDWLICNFALEENCW